MSFAMRALAAVCPPDHVYRAALYADDIDFDEYEPAGEIKGAGYAAGGNALTGYRIFEDAETGEAVLSFSTTEWLNADIRAKAALIYDATTGYRVSIMTFPRHVGVLGGWFELKMPDEGVVRLGGHDGD